MAANNLSNKQQAGWIARQVSTINQLFPGSCKKKGKYALNCRCRITPTELSDTYLVQIRYAYGESPKVYVLSPALIPNSKGKLPHVFASDNRLCLHYPKDKSWTDRKLIANTIIPWTAEWLFHYECWLATGSWNGGGIEHE